MNYFLYEKLRAAFIGVAEKMANSNLGTMFTHDFFVNEFNTRLTKPMNPKSISGFVSNVRVILETNHNKSLTNIHSQGWVLVTLAEKQQQQTTKRETKKKMENMANTFGHSAMIIGQRSKWSPEHGIFALKTIQQKGRTKEAIRIISDKVGVTETSVSQKLAEYGKAARDQRYSSLSLEEGITKYHMDGCPLAPHKLNK